MGQHWQLLVGVYSFHGNSKSYIIEDHVIYLCSEHSEQLCDLIGKMLSVESSQRPNITEVINTLTQLHSLIQN